MARRADDDIEGDLDHDGRFHLAVPAEPGDRVRLEPAGHLGDLGVRQAAVGLADVDQLATGRIANGERVVAQHAVTLAVPALHADDHAIDRGQRLLHLQPAEAAPTGRIGAARVLDHQALVASGAGGGEGGLQGGGIGRGDEMRSREATAIKGEWQVDRVQPGAALRQRRPKQRFDRLAARPQRQHVEGDVDDRHLGPDGVRRRLAPQPPLEGDERQDHAVAPGQDLTIEDPVPGQRGRCADDLRIARADVVQVARVEPDFGPELVELCPDPVVLVLHPDLRAEPGDDLGRILGWRGEHELERMEERQ